MRNSSADKKLSVSVCLLAVFLMLVLDLVVASEGNVYRSEFQTPEEGQLSFQDTKPISFRSVTLNKEDLKRELMRQLQMLQEAEENILSKIRQLDAERRALTNRKRSHYSSMCMFNVVACYRK